MGGIQGKNINLRFILDLSVKVKSVKLLEENQGSLATRGRHKLIGQHTQRNND